jgi:hypothetical protein
MLVSSNSEISPINVNLSQKSDASRGSEIIENNGPSKYGLHIPQKSKQMIQITIIIFITVIHMSSICEFMMKFKNYSLIKYSKNYDKSNKERKTFSQRHKKYS